MINLMICAIFLIAVSSVEINGLFIIYENVALLPDDLCIFVLLGSMFCFWTVVLLQQLAESLKYV